MNGIIYFVLSGRLGAWMELQILMRQTAKAFAVNAPKTAGLSAKEILKAYAQFTAKEALRAMQSGQNLETLCQKLYQMAYVLGSRLRRWLNPKNEEDCLAIITMLYRNIGIQICEEETGHFCVRKCYFSSFYTREICNVISAIDKGIFAGVYQGGKLSFRERITEGCSVCRADFRK
ncbi:MAG: hypothetical protein LUI12_04070 [Clostridiales bacterium]|nr:hypothetical protein [Clostridiales bacterium]